MVIDVHETNDYKRGIKDGIPIFLGYLAVSFSFGIQAKKMGLDLAQSGILSASNVTSAGQFAGLTMMFSGATLLELAIAQLIINSRYILMSGALSQKISTDESLLNRLVMAHGITDEIFALSIAEVDVLKPVYFYGLMTSAIPGWIIGTILGVLSGNLLPEPLLDALGIALYGMLIAIIIPPAKKNRIIAGLVITSMASSYLFTKLPLLKTLSPAMIIIILTIVITSISAYFFPIPEVDNE